MHSLRREERQTKDINECPCSRRRTPHLIEILPAGTYHSFTGRVKDKHYYLSILVTAHNPNITKDCIEYPSLSLFSYWHPNSYKTPNPTRFTFALGYCTHFSRVFSILMTSTRSTPTTRSRHNSITTKHLGWDFGGLSHFGHFPPSPGAPSLTNLLEYHWLPTTLKICLFSTLCVQKLFFVPTNNLPRPERTLERDNCIGPIATHWPSRSNPLGCGHVCPFSDWERRWIWFTLLSRSLEMMMTVGRESLPNRAVETTFRRIFLRCVVFRKKSKKCNSFPWKFSKISNKKIFAFLRPWLGA